MAKDSGHEGRLSNWMYCTDVYDFLDQIRRRPDMWLRDGSLHHLESILLGYRVALGVHAAEEPFAFWPEDSFVSWLRENGGHHSSLGWATDIEHGTPRGSTPLTEFFRLLDAYRAEGSRPDAGTGNPASERTTEHPGLRIVRVELARHAWEQMRCGCGESAGHIPAELLRVITARTPGEATMAGFDGHVLIQSNLMPPAPAATAVVLAALADPTLTAPFARATLLGLLLSFSGGDTVEQEECVSLIRGGVWTLYRELADHPSVEVRELAHDVLANLGTEDDRLAAFREGLRDRLPEYLD
ncbi:hypothetical protein ABZ883_33595 [Streptomyces sp. NPDC046977]|uniref:hypothetical protein n=1 Tax=Streptomyces sp. NPDC046977 TaxID=3154703 RepID=UPI0033D4994E